MSSLEEATKGVVGFTLGGGPSSARMYEEAASLSDLELSYALLGHLTLLM